MCKRLINSFHYVCILGLPDDRAWGSERNKFYGADVSDDDFIGMNDNLFYLLCNTNGK